MHGWDAVEPLPSVKHDHDISRENGRNQQWRPTADGQVGHGLGQPVLERRPGMMLLRHERNRSVIHSRAGKLHEYVCRCAGAAEQADVVRTAQLAEHQVGQGVVDAADTVANDGATAKLGDLSPASQRRQPGQPWGPKVGQGQSRNDDIDQIGPGQGHVPHAGIGHDEDAGVVDGQRDQARQCLFSGAVFPGEQGVRRGA